MHKVLSFYGNHLLRKNTISQLLNENGAWIQGYDGKAALL
jgi:hypothetical protein